MTLWVLWTALAATPSVEDAVKTQLVDRLASVRVERIEAEAELAAWTQQVESGDLHTVALAMGDVGLADQVRQAHEARLARVELATVYGEKHPTLIEARNKEARMATSVEESVGRALAARKIEIEVLQSVHTTLEAELKALGR